MAGALAFMAAGGLEARADGLPRGFVYLHDVAPSAVQDMRYATPDNFTGKPVPGYGAAECVLKRGAAEALQRAQEKAQAQGFSLRVYDCYRPVRAVRAFLAWAAAPEDRETKRYYPHLRKSQLVPGYIAQQSGHSAGAALDLTLIPAAAAGSSGSGAGTCTEPGSEDAASLDMGTAFDCFDPKANTDSSLATPAQRKNRGLLRRIMESSGFKNYPAEWWHFSYGGAGLRRYDFAIEPRPAQ